MGVLFSLLLAFCIMFIEMSLQDQFFWWALNQGHFLCVNYFGVTFVGTCHSGCSYKHTEKRGPKRRSHGFIEDVDGVYY